MGYITSLFLSVATGFCMGQTADGTQYSAFIQQGQAGYKNEPSWSTEVRRGQAALLKQGKCKAIKF